MGSGRLVGAGVGVGEGVGLGVGVAAQAKVAVLVPIVPVNLVGQLIWIESPGFRKIGAAAAANEPPSRRMTATQIPVRRKTTTAISDVGR